MKGRAQSLRGRGSAKGKVDNENRKATFQEVAVHARLSAVQLEQDVGCKKAVCDRSPPPPANSPDDLWTLRGRNGSQQIYKLFGWPCQQLTWSEDNAGTMTL